MHNSFKIIKSLFHFMLLDMFWTPQCPSSGASYCCTCSLWSPCRFRSVVSSSLALLLLPFSCVSHTTVSIIRNLLLLHMQSLFTVWCWVCCFLQFCALVPVVFVCVTDTHENSSNNRARLEETTDPTPHGEQRLHVQQ
jgi:hypothetical protein